MAKWFDGHIDEKQFPKQMLEVMDSFGAPPPFPDLEEMPEDIRKHEVERWKVGVGLWQTQFGTMMEAAKGGIEISKVAISQILIINAGACVALLALLGNLAGRDIPTLASVTPNISKALLIYALGIVLAVLVSGIGVLAIRATLKRKVKAAIRWNVVQYILFVGSLSAFATGTYVAATSLVRW